MTIWTSLRAALAVLLLLPALARAAEAIEIQEVTSAGGVTAWLVNEPAVPLIAMEFSFRAGAAYDPEGRAGLANMVSALLDEGAGELDSLAFQTRLEDLAVELDFGASRDEFSGSLKTLAENRDEAFDLLRLALTAPRFDEAAVERIRQQILVKIIRDEQDPTSIAWRNWFAAAFPDHPYGRPTDGTRDSVAAITREDLKDFVGQRLIRDDLVIAVVGDITAEELRPLLDRTFGALPAKGAPTALPDIEPKAVGETKLVRMEIPQSVVVFGADGLKRDDSDWYAAYLMNYVLGGGGLTSRLTEEVREKRGLAYSAYSYLLPLEHTGLFLGGVGTQNARVAESLDVIRGELARLRDQGLSREELDNAKTYVNGSFPLSLTSSDKIAGLLVSVQRYDLGIDYLDRREMLINAVTTEDIKRVAKRLLKPQELTVVVVGNPDKLTTGG